MSGTTTTHMIVMMIIRESMALFYRSRFAAVKPSGRRAICCEIIAELLT